MNITHEELIGMCRAFAEANVHSVLQTIDRFVPQTRAINVSNRISINDVAAQRFTDNGDGTVTDHTTGLKWTKDNVGSGEMKHADAMKACEELRLAGHADWRAPTRAELLTLVDDTRCAPAIDTAAFPSCKGGWYWSSTTYAGGASCAWVVHFSDGDCGSGHRDSKAFVRAVRPAAGQ